MKAYLVKELCRLSKVANDSNLIDIKLLLDSVRASIVADQTEDFARHVINIVAMELMPDLKTRADKENLNNFTLN